MKNLWQRYGWVPALIPAWIFVAVLYFKTDDLPYFWDGSEYLLRSEEIYDHFLSGARMAFYLERHWKGTLLPNLGAGLLTLSSGHALSVVYWIGFFSLSLLGLQLFFLFRHWLSADRAFLGTLLLMSSKWLLRRTPQFMNELPFAACFFGGLRWLMDPELPRSTRAQVWAGIWFALSLCFRPFEGAFLIVCVFAGNRINPFRKAILIPFLIPLLWYLPVAGQTWKWAVGSGLLTPFTGRMAHQAGQYGYMSVFDFLRDLWDTYHGLWLAILTISALVVTQAKKSWKSAKPWLAWAPLILLHPLLGTNSLNSDIRYYIVSVIAAYVVFLVLTLSSGRAALALVALLAAHNIYNSISIVFPMPAVPLLHGDWSASMWPVLKAHLPEKKPLTILVLLHPRPEEEGPYNCHINLYIRAHEERIGWTFVNDPKKNTNELDAAIVGPVNTEAEAREFLSRETVDGSKWEFVGTFQELPTYADRRVFALFKKLSSRS